MTGKVFVDITTESFALACASVKKHTPLLLPFVTSFSVVTRAQNRLTPSCDSFHLPTAKAALISPFTVWAFAAGPKTNRRNKQIKPNASLILICAPFRTYLGR